MKMVKSTLAVLTTAAVLGVSGFAHAGATLDAVKKKGFVQCGISDGLPGFSYADAKGKYDNIATLNANADRLNDDWMTMQIVFTPNQGPVGTYTVEVRLGGEVVYKDPKVTNGTGSSGSDKLLSEVADNNKTILFTNHWDSGVRFRNVDMGGAP